MCVDDNELYPRRGFKHGEGEPPLNSSSQVKGRRRNAELFVGFKEEREEKVN